MAQQYLETTHQTVNWFQSAARSNQLEIAPPFQRRPVWSAKQKSDLIGTILVGYPIPELYVHELIGADGDELHRLVDGQQRVRAVLEFLDNEFELSDSEAVPQAFHAKRFDDLDDAAKRTIRSYKFVVRTLKDVDDAVVREMFRRLNQGVVALNDQELRHATYSGPFIHLIESISDRNVWNDFGIFSAEDVRRMRDVEMVSELAVAVLNGPQNKKATLDKWYQAYELEFPEAASLESTFDAVLNHISLAVPEIKKTRWRKRSDFYSLFCAFARIEAKLPLNPRELSSVIDALEKFAVKVDEAVRLSDESTLADGGAETEDSSAGQHEGASAELSDDAERYADAVERAATDLSRRRVREQILVGVLRAAIAEDVQYESD